MLPEDHAKRAKDNDLRVQCVDEKRDTAAHPVACRCSYLKCLRIGVENGFDQVSDWGIGTPAGRVHLCGQMNQSGAGGEGFPATTLSECKRTVFGEAPVADFSGRICGSAEDSPVDDEACADPCAEGEEDKMLQVWTRLADTKMKFRKCSGIAVVFNTNGDAGERLLKMLL